MTPTPPALVIHPAATPTEIAAVVAVLASLPTDDEPPAPAPSAWAASGRTPAPRVGPGAGWRRSADPDRWSW